MDQRSTGSCRKCCARSIGGKASTTSSDSETCSRCRCGEVERGSVKSYRLFPAERFSISVIDAASRARFVEHMPSGLVLRYRGMAGAEAELPVGLDVFEMLQRLNEGYRPSVEEEQGYYLSLAVFKNPLGSAPYQEVLLTMTGHDFYRVARHADGRLEMSDWNPRRRGGGRSDGLVQARPGVPAPQDQLPRLQADRDGPGADGVLRPACAQRLPEPAAPHDRAQHRGIRRGVPGPSRVVHRASMPIGMSWRAGSRRT